MKPTIIIMLVVAISAGFLLASYTNYKAFANSSTVVDQGILEQLYKAAFGRPLDSEAGFHIGRDLNMVLTDINSSPEKRYYSALFKAVKAYEEALRAPGNLSPEDKAKYLEAIDSALATLLAWVETLPEHPICEGVVRPEEARQAIVEAYQGILSPLSRTNAEQGVFNPSKYIGNPSNLALPVFRCTNPPTPTPTFTPCYMISGVSACGPLPTPTITPTCQPRPTCLDAQPACYPPVPIGGWCPKPTPTVSFAPLPL